MESFLLDVGLNPSIGKVHGEGAVQLLRLLGLCLNPSIGKVHPDKTPVDFGAPDDWSQSLYR